MRWKGLLVFLAIVFLSACARRVSSPVLKAPRTVAVLPFEAVCEPEGILFPCPVKEIAGGEIAPEAPEVLDNLLREMLSGRPGFRFVSREEYQALREEFLAQTERPTLVEWARFLGKRLSVEALLYARVFRYQERWGRGYAVERPASVAFALVLFEARSGRILWKAWFDETQQPLSENLFKIRLYGGVRWLTARELAQRGLRQLLKDFPYPSGS
ncbi:hypothetical protein FVE67_03460 [Thermosulfurimonas marina]|uniref:Uncharacterized protein n=1 Tax=Thermosulfurimonas marina TaxID=2047767 RepID=A0A6H1WRX6_9BACT|nr:hypothetical protein [Thermosulfurimonas marina]QJA05909.1 hypothetical protein FVE67_03460 [Thermosulfurimonas marina]